LATSRAAVRPQPIRQAPEACPAHPVRQGPSFLFGVAQRNLIARLLGCLPHCLATGQHYNENAAFPAAAQATRTVAA